MADLFEGNKMATLRINSDALTPVEVTVRESDPITKSVFVEIIRRTETDGHRGCNEMFITPEQLESLGRFLIRQADEIRTAQVMRA
jgi:hypothetical protein